MRVHHAQWHLDRIELEAVVAGHLEGVQVDRRILMAGEPDVSDLASRARVLERAIGALVVEHPIGILEPDDLVMLDEVDAVGLEAAEAGVELTRRFRTRPAVDLRHEERPLAVAILERAPHPLFTQPFVVVPGVVEKGDPPVDRGANQPNTEGFVDALDAEVPAAETDRRHLLTSPAERPARDLRRHPWDS